MKKIQSSASLFCLVAVLMFMAACAPAPQGGATMASRSDASPQMEAATSVLVAPPSSHVQPQVRRDLGTVWGESRPSQMTQAFFERHNHMAPDAVTALYYNDEKGVDAALSMEGVRRVETVKSLRLAEGVSLSVLDERGDPMPLRLGSKNWLSGVAGERYTLRFKNESKRRYEVVASVDGLDVINGRPAHYSNSGYLLEPGQDLVIDGFRTSASSVAAFRFGNASLSYAATKGSEAARHIGVIGVALFGERVHMREGAHPFPGQTDHRFAQPPY